MTIARELVTLIRYEVDASGLNKLPRQVSPGIDKVTDSANRGSSAVSRFGSVIRGALAGFGIMSLMKMADEWAGVEGRVGLVTNGIEEQKQALAGLYAIAQSTGQAYGATAGLFQSVQRNAKELKLTLKDSLSLTETIGTALTIGGGTQASQHAALVQLGQALGSGTLRGEELNSVMEQAPRLAQAIAEAFNVPIGKLKDLGKAGKLTSKELAAGLLRQSRKLHDEFDRMPLTFSRAFTRLSNSLGQQVDKLNKSSGAARLFYKATSLIVDNLAVIIKYLAYIGAAAALTKLTRAATAAGGAVGAIRAAITRMGGGYAVGALIGTFLRMLAVVTAIYYVFDDISVWFKGGESLIGDVLGPMKDWKWLADAVVTSLTWVKNLLGGSAQALSIWLSKWGMLAVVIGGIVAIIGLIPTIIVGVIIAFAGFFNYVRKNWDAIKTWASSAGTSIADSINQAWEDIKQRAIQVWGEISRVISDAIPDFVKKGFAWQGQVIGEGIGNLQQAAQWAGVMPTRPGTAGTGPVTQTANVTVNAQTNTPAAVADAARRGTQDALGAAALPQVEVSR